MLDRKKVYKVELKKRLGNPDNLVGGLIWESEWIDITDYFVERVQAISGNIDDVTFQGNLEQESVIIRLDNVTGRFNPEGSENSFWESEGYIYHSRIRYWEYYETEDKEAENLYPMIDGLISEDFRYLKNKLCTITINSKLDILRDHYIFEDSNPAIRSIDLNGVYSICSKLFNEKYSELGVTTTGASFLNNVIYEDIGEYSKNMLDMVYDAIRDGGSLGGLTYDGIFFISYFGYTVDIDRDLPQTANTVALYKFTEGSGTSIAETVGYEPLTTAEAETTPLWETGILNSSAYRFFGGLAWNFLSSVYDPYGLSTYVVDMLLTVSKNQIIENNLSLNPTYGYNYNIYSGNVPYSTQYSTVVAVCASGSSNIYLRNRLTGAAISTVNTTNNVTALGGGDTTLTAKFFTGDGAFSTHRFSEYVSGSGVNTLATITTSIDLIDGYDAFVAFCTGNDFYTYTAGTVTNRGNGGVASAKTALTFDKNNLGDIYVGNNSGEVLLWDLSATSFTSLGTPEANQVNDLIIGESDNLYAGYNSTGKIYRYESGTTWTLVVDPAECLGGAMSLTKMAFQNNHLYLGYPTKVALYRGDDFETPASGLVLGKPNATGVDPTATSPLHNLLASDTYGTTDLLMVDASGVNRVYFQSRLSQVVPAPLFAWCDYATRSDKLFNLYIDSGATINSEGLFLTKSGDIQYMVISNAGATMTIHVNVKVGTLLTEGAPTLLNMYVDNTDASVSISLNGVRSSKVYIDPTYLNSVTQYKMIGDAQDIYGSKTSDMHRVYYSGLRIDNKSTTTFFDDSKTLYNKIFGSSYVYS